LRGDQVFPSAAFNASGGFVVWQDNFTDPGGLGVSVLKLGPDLAPVGAPQRVNQTLGLDQQRARVAMLNDNGAVTVWQSGRPGAQNVFARFLAASGGFAGDELLVNNAALNTVNRYVTNWVLIRNNRPRTQKFRIREVVKARHEFNANPVVATLNDGSVVVAYASSRVYTTNSFTLRETLRWDDRHAIFITNRVRVPLNVQIDAMQDVYLQRVSALGQKLGEEFRVNQFIDFNQRDAAVAALDNGNLVITWVSEQQRFGNSIDVYARIFDHLGNPLTGELLVNATNRPCSAPSVAGTAGGGFTIAWTQKSLEVSNSLDIVARTFAANGSATSEAFGVNAFRYGDQYAATVVNLGAQQVIAWTSLGQDGSWEGVYARAFAGAAPLGDEFRVNVGTRFSQKHGRVATDGAGRALFYWSGYTLDSGFDLFGRPYAAP